MNDDTRPTSGVAPDSRARVAEGGNAGPPASSPTPPATLLESLLTRAPSAFGFFQAVRTLERLRPNRSEPGRFVDPAMEVVRFTVNPSIAFPPAEIHSLELRDDGPASMSVNFFGLTGPSGVLPRAYSALVAERLQARDGALAAFLDLFNHRMVSLFYRAWQKNQVAVCHEKDGDDDRMGQHLLDLFGLGLEADRELVGPLQQLLSSYVGLLALRPRGAVALEQLLEDVFDVAVEVEQFVGGVYPLYTADQCALGEEDGDANRLGCGAVLGDEVWDQQTRVRIRMGPLDNRRHADLLPTGSGHELLAWLVRFFGHDTFDFEAQLILAREDVAGCVLDDEGEPKPLGWSTWLRTMPMLRDPDDTVIRL